MNRKIAIAAALSLIFAASPVLSCYAKSEPSQTKCHISYPVANGIFTHGSMICNPEWMDRDASLIMVSLTSGCKSMGEQKLASLIMRGMRDFDRKVEELGKIDACKMLDDAMINVEKAAAK